MKTQTVVFAAWAVAAFAAASSSPAASVAAAAATQAVELTSDQAHRAFPARYPVTLGAGAAKSGLVAVALPGELRRPLEPPYRDLRLVRKSSQGDQDVPFWVDEAPTAAGPTVWRGAARDVQRDPVAQRSVWLLELGQSRSFDELTLVLENPDGSAVAKPLTIEAAIERGGPFRPLRDAVVALDRPCQPTSKPGTTACRLQRLSWRWEQLQSALILRLTADDKQSVLLPLQEVLLQRSLRSDGRLWTREVALAPLPDDVTTSTSRKHPELPPPVHRYRLLSAPDSSLTQLTLQLSQPAFVYGARLLELPRTPAGTEPRLSDGVELAHGALFRLPPGVMAERARPAVTRPADSVLPVEELSLTLSKPPHGGTLVLELQDYSASEVPAVTPQAVMVEGSGPRLLFMRDEAQAGADQYTLYAGSATVRAPLHDHKPLREALTKNGALSIASLGAKVGNPRYQPAPPMSFVPTQGAPLDVLRFRLQRALVIDGAEDIYAAELQPLDLGLLRSDLGDVRIVDAQDRQVPYVLERDGAATLATLDWRADSDPGARKTRYTLRLLYNGRALPIPYGQLELQMKETFYDRAARLYERADLEAPEQDLWRGRLTRGGEGTPAVHRLPLDWSQRGELVLELQDDDNPPLTLQEARGLVPAPRLLFKMTPGSGYRMLLGNAQLSSPHYDLEALRGAILDYAALPARLGPLVPNPAFRPTAVDYLRNAPPTILLWSALGLAMVVLLVLTVRLLAKDEVSSTDGG